MTANIWKLAAPVGLAALMSTLGTPALATYHEDGGHGDGDGDHEPRATLEAGFYYNSVVGDGDAAEEDNLLSDRDNGDGYYVSGILPMGERFFAFGDFSHERARYELGIPADPDPIEVNPALTFQSLDLGIGATFPVNDTFSVSGKGGLALTRTEVTRATGQFDLKTDHEVGGLVELEMTWMALERFALSAGAGWSSLYEPGVPVLDEGGNVVLDIDGGAYGMAGLRFHFSDQTSLNVSAKIGTTAKVRAGLAYHF